MKLLLKNCLIFSDLVNNKTCLSNILLQDGFITNIFSCKENISNVNEMDLNGAYVVPGLIDIHTHISIGGTAIGIPPSKAGYLRGTTAVFDAGTYGADTFKYFVDEVISKSTTKVYGWLNIASKGLLDLHELSDINNIEPTKIKDTVNEYSDKIVGLKLRASGSVVGQSGIRPIELGKEIASDLGLPVMLHIGNPPPHIDDVLNLMESGDVVTHSFHNKKLAAIVSEDGIRASAIKAKERGVLFDVGHGNESFSFNVAGKALESGFIPDFVSTDIYEKNMDTIAKSQLYVINKMLSAGLTLGECIYKATAMPAEKFKLKDMGHIRVGNVADFTVFSVLEKECDFRDSQGNISTYNKYLNPKGVFINGEYYESEDY